MKKFDYYGKIFNYELSKNYIIVDGKKLPIKEGEYGYTYRLMKKCISTESAEDLINWMNNCIADKFALCLINKIFEHVKSYGTPAE